MFVFVVVLFVFIGLIGMASFLASCRSDLCVTSCCLILCDSYQWFLLRSDKKCLEMLLTNRSGAKHFPLIRQIVVSFRTQHGIWISYVTPPHHHITSLHRTAPPKADGKKQFFSLPAVTHMCGKWGGREQLRVWETVVPPAGRDAHVLEEGAPGAVTYVMNSVCAGGS